MTESIKQQTSHFSFPEVRVVEASAGSGKTYALAKRYVQLVLNPQLALEQTSIRSILAITFTNKAAFEMKARIFQFLKSLALGEMPIAQAQDILDPIGLDYSTAKQKAYLITEELIHRYNFFQVQTIDKFINALLSGCAFKIGLTANFKIKTNSSEYLQYSLDQLIDQAQFDKSLFDTFSEFLNNYLYLENRSGWFPKKDILAVSSALFMQSNTYGLEFEQAAFRPEDLIKLKRQILSQMNRLREILPVGTNSGFMKALEKFLTEHTKGFDIDSISGYFARADVPINKGVEVPKQVDQLWEKIRQNLIQVCEQEAVSLYNPYIAIYQRVKDVLAKFSQKDDILFLEELNKKASTLFDEDYVTVEELYYRLATRFRHYLIDEFQDTSQLQWHNVERLTEEALSTGGSLFYVGDRKQAIYGFRGGDVSLFDQVKENYAAFNVQMESLLKNWRSQKEIVEFNNHVFSSDNLRQFFAKKTEVETTKRKKNPVHFNEDDLNYLEGIFAQSTQLSDERYNQGYVKIEHINEDQKDQRDDAIRQKLVDLVKDVHKRYEYRDIAILTRGNKQVEQITQWLLEENVLVESERTSNIRENALILELIALLKFLNSPIDNVAFANFVLGDIFSKGTGIANGDVHQFLFRQHDLLRKTKDFYLYHAFREQYPDAWNQFLNEFYQNVGLYPLYEMMISLYDRFHCLENFTHSQGFFMHFLELIKKQEDDHPDIDSFLTYFENLIGDESYVKIAKSNAVKVLTIHKSKGLEFPVVIVPFLSMDIQVGASSNDMQQSYVLHIREQKAQLLRLKTSYYAFSDQLFNIYCAHYKQAFLSELNNVYVALTRAKNELYGFYSNKVGNRLNDIQFLLPEGGFESGSKSTLPSIETEKSLVTLEASQYYDWMKYLQEEFLDPRNLQHRKRFLKGEIYHYLLSFVFDLNFQDIPTLIRKIKETASKKFIHLDHWDEHIENLKRILKEPLFKPFFYPDQAQIFNEQEIVDQFGQTKRIDRLIVGENVVAVIDYKSSYDEDLDYQKQVEKYVQMIKKMYPQKQVKGYLLYLDELKVQEV